MSVGRVSLRGAGRGRRGSDAPETVGPRENVPARPRFGRTAPPRGVSRYRTIVPVGSDPDKGGTCPAERWLLVAFALARAPEARAEPVTAAPGPTWSETSNGLRARLSMRRSHVSNGTGIVTTYLELNNVGDVMNPLLVSGQDLEFHVTDADGRDVPCSGLPYDGPVLGPLDLRAPPRQPLRFRIGSPGFGIPADHAALLDLGPKYGWALPKDGKRYDLRAVLEIPAVKDDRSGSAIRWHGRLELPRVRIPTEAAPPDPATVGGLHRRPGGEDARERRQRFRTRRPRAVAHRRPEGRSLVRQGDQVRRLLAKIRNAWIGSLGSGRRRVGRPRDRHGDAGADMSNGSTAALAAPRQQHPPQRRSRVARSPHPRAMALLWTMEKDPAMAVRVTVVQAAGGGHARVARAPRARDARRGRDRSRRGRAPLGGAPERSREYERDGDGALRSTCASLRPRFIRGIGGLVTRVPGERRATRIRRSLHPRSNVH